jgi:glycosyltransferase involved in cell wall biosynthesis/ADP-ribose pyrophosphatase YjhB (NUDIX family)
MPDTPLMISVLTPCFNEADNVRTLYERVRAVFDQRPEYAYEHVFIDNASTDATVAILRELAARDRRVKVIVNTRNFGHIRSPYHGLLQCYGDAVIGMAADLQDPPELIPAFLDKWREGYKVVLGVKKASEESALMFAIRRFGYAVIDRLSEVRQVRNSTGFGLYDREFMDVLRRLPDPYPYFRGIVAELGFRYATIPYVQPQRVRGVTKNNLYRLYDIGLQGIVNHSRIPLRLATLLGFVSSIVSLAAALVYFVMKMLFWYNLPIGIAPLIIGLFGAASVQLLFLGIMGEYVSAIHAQVRNRPLVIEQERINFEDDGHPAGVHPTGGTLQRSIEILDAAVPDPRRGLPAEVFRFASRIVPLVNVDLLIQDEQSRTLLTWRDDQRFGTGWHLPGGIIRFKETAVDRVRACAREELGVDVACEDAPLLVSEVIDASRVRGHHVSLLFRCRVQGAPDAARRATDPPSAGQWWWHDSCPPDLIETHRRYAPYL